MMKKHIFRAGAFAAAVAGLTLLASCDFMECKDDDVSYSLSATSSTSFNGSYGMSTTGTATLSVTWQNWSSALTSRAASLGDLSDYFDIYLLDSSGNDITAKALTSATFTATDAVTAIDTSGTSASSGASVPVSITLKLSEPVDQSDCSGTLGFVAKPAATDRGSYLSCDSSIAFSFQKADWSLIAPTTSVLAAAGVGVDTSANTYATQLNLAAGLKKEVEAKSVIGKVTAGGETVDLCVSSAAAKGATSLSAYFNTTSALTTSDTTITVTYLMKYVDDGSGSTGSYGANHVLDNVLTKVRKVYSGQNFNGLSETEVNALFTIKNASLALTTDDAEYGTYPSYQIANETDNSRGAYFPLSNIPTSGKYCIEFDAALSPSSTSNSKSQVSEFGLVTAAPASGAAGWTWADDTLFALAANMGEENWYLNPTAMTDTTITATNYVSLTKYKFYHYKFEIDIDASTIKTSISDSGTPLVDSAETTLTSQELAHTATSYVAAGIRIRCGRYRKDSAGFTTKQSIDNIVVYSNIE